ncbi:hypothetical protein [Streptomyces sp. NBC_01264]|uniref:hypothetical protein n=1 Tax=Streptomyces sp. NBC_01264 TaxID=2903804 RepID=UPI00225947B3|nr:hypothetical protein [Streptomyces sp. NBC_01264]MCX4778113.1 hypothetical protein [Streptomyces sp. NBC_01264]
MNWDAHDARATGLTPKAEAALIQGMAKLRAQEARDHKAGCRCVACQVRRIDANMRALRKQAADAKAVA